MDLVYVTENVLGMAFPGNPRGSNSNSNSNRGPPGCNDINEVSAYLQQHHANKYMIWNISEETYDCSAFNNQVLEHKFPVESWLDADKDNVAVIHCLTGRGRTAALTACVLAWMGEFPSPVAALDYISQRKGVPVDVLTIASQRRYVQYFANTLDGVKPCSEPLLLRRIIMSSIPTFNQNPQGESGCCPYVQLFKNGKLICTSSPRGSSAMPAGGSSSSSGSNNSSSSSSSDSLGLRWIGESEGCVSFNVDCAVQGDILLRCRHADTQGGRVSMFRAAFHTGYVPQGVLRLTKVQLDGSEGSSRFDDDFFIDLIFASIGAYIYKLIYMYIYVYVCIYMYIYVYVLSPYSYHQTHSHTNRLLH
eukprot:GSChrysophyteH2.ASY1.ANO1.93.1 assembled CDS